eukprot:CAMPEP_0194599008 /NCGR_PEP_ID=MMETSP0292-20121207/27362_1 /TAXON_ID=39354 /ORGANISM="Heterosigma akashiwo, Strain CCMP2393" /LENGTH=79 /DNA_ID=CAMNT_0039460105 /DNA_START=357 /DNA_END=593 /DNA_ORIENTATION=+
MQPVAGLRLPLQPQRAAAAGRRRRRPVRRRRALPLAAAAAAPALPNGFAGTRAPCRRMSPAGWNRWGGAPLAPRGGAAP